MYRNKHGLVKRTLFRLYDRVPVLGRVKGLFLPFKLKSFSKRLDARTQAVAAGRAANGCAPLFDHIEIETFNRCNGECGFCPVNRHLDPRQPQRMTDELYASIISQLRQLDYQGEVCLYSNNESLLDNRLEAFTRMARQELPNARILLSTNGTLLTPERYTALVDHIDLFYVNNYCDDFQLTPTHAAIMELAKTKPEWWEKTHIVVRYRKELMSSRGGMAPNKKNAQPRTLNVGCTFVASQMIVRPDGKLSLCCNDALGTVTLGDLTKQKIAEAWNSELYEDVRTRVLAGRDAMPLCRHCDTLGD